MSRWIQHPVTHELIPAHLYVRPSEQHFIHGDIEPFISPLDGSVVGSRREYVDHCKKHGVVPAQEFSPSYYEEKAKERERFYTNELSPQERRRRRQQMYEITVQLERG